MKIGILGGTFDPIHTGHLVIAEEVKAYLGLTEILFIPAGQPWLKAGQSISPAEHRVRMVELAIAGKPYFKLSRVEVERAGPTYTVDTLVELQKQFHGQADLYFILGWDALSDLPLWKEPERLIRMCHLVAIPRPGSVPPDPKTLEKALPGLSQSLIMLNKPEIDISASEIRERAARGLPIGHLVPPAVAEYIKENRLYVKTSSVKPARP